MIRLKQLLCEEKLRWTNPSMSHAEEGLENVSEELFLTKRSIIENFKKGKIVFLGKSILEKIKNSKSPKIESFLELQDFIHKKQKSNPEYIRDWKDIKNKLKNNQPVPAPIIMKYKQDYYLIDGNIRLTVARLTGTPIYAYVFVYQG